MRLIKYILTACLLGFSLSSIAASDDLDLLHVYNQNVGTYLSGNLTVIGGSAYLGYLFSPNFGVELGVDHLDSGPFLIFEHMTVTIYHADLKGIALLGQRGQLFGKVGVGLSDISNDVFLLDTRTNKTVFAATFGAGLSYFFTRHLSGTFEVNGATSEGLYTRAYVVYAIPSVGLTYYFS